jgi:hypothetical protein
MTARPPIAAGGARPGTTAGDLEIFDPSAGVWRRVYQSGPAHFRGSYDPETPSTILNNTWIPMPITDVDSTSRVTLVGGNSLRIEEAGTYQCNGQVRFDTGVAAGTGLRCRFTVNGVEKRQFPHPPTVSAVALALSCQFDFAVSDVLKFEVHQDQGSSRLFNLNEVWNFVDIARVG